MSLKLEIALVVLVSALVFVPGIWSYSLVDPWETHYGEVAREMLEDNDLVHTKWRGTFYSNPTDNEGFRSKPVLMFWMMAAGMRAVGVGEDGGYSGEMVSTVRVMIGIRLPFILSAIAGLTLVWFMLARLVSRRMAWLALCVVGAAPIYALIGRNAIPDMPLTACTMGAIAMFVMAVEDGDRPIRPLGYLFRRRFAFDARHVVLALAGAFVFWQAAYYLIYFLQSPAIAVRTPMPSPALWLPLMIALLFGALGRDGWLILRLFPILIGGIICAVKNTPMPYRRAGQSLWRHIFDDILGVWEKESADRYLLAVLPLLLLTLAFVLPVITFVPAPTRVLLFLVTFVVGVIWGVVFWTGRWPALWNMIDHLVRMAPLTSMRQVYLLAAYFLVGVSILAKGPPGMTVVAGVAAFHVMLNWRWRELYTGGFELKRSLLMMAAVAVPWHVAMWLKDGVQFVEQYIMQHIINRAGDGSVDKSLGTFARIAGSAQGYTTQIGHGMWLWAALLPAAFAVMFVRANRETREGRVRFHIGTWAIVSMFVFCIVQVKYHHYILPVVVPLGLLVAFYLDDLFAGRERLPLVFALLASGIVLLVTRDLMHEPERWIEMFVYRYDRPWPTLEPYQIDPSDGVLALGIAAVIAIVVTTRAPRIGVALLAAVGVAIGAWALHAYMPHAGKHWGMRDAVRTYYKSRTVYGHTRVYFGAGQCLQHVRAADTYSFETFIPDTLHPGQPMHLTLRLHKASDAKVMETETVARGAVTKIGDHEVTFQLFPGERAKVEKFIAECKRRVHAKELQFGRPPVLAVDADRLIAWQLYWRGENFWSGGEIWSWLPEMKTSFVPANNTEVVKYLNDRTRAPLGRRYFVITEAGRIMGMSQVVPTTRARDTYEVLDTTSNKFSLAAFYL